MPGEAEEILGVAVKVVGDVDAVLQVQAGHIEIDRVEVSCRRRSNVDEYSLCRWDEKETGFVFTSSLGTRTEGV